MEIIASKKGKLKLIYRGFSYTEHSRNKARTIIYWRCAERAQCNAKTHTNADIENLEIIIDGTNKHIGHVPDHRQLTADKVMRGIKRLAEDHPNQPPQQIIRQGVGAIRDPEVLAKLPERNTMRRAVNVHQNRGRPRNPRMLSDIEVDAPYSTTQRGTRFLLSDYDPEDPGQILVFCSDECHKLLCDSEEMFADGTFTTVPEQFGQLYTVHGIVKDNSGQKNVFPLVFCLTVRKDENTYRKIWQRLTDEAVRKNRRFKAKVFMTDLELAALNAQRCMFAEAEHKVCLFHLNQQLWKHLVDLGLRPLYLNENNEEHTVRHDIQRLLALPFVPLADLEVFDIVEVADDRVVPLALYIENTYIRGHRLRRRPAVPPRYPPQMWNVYDSAISNMHRTNNVVESYHSKFLKLIVVHHANVWRFIDEIKKEHDTVQLVQQIRAGHNNVRAAPAKKYQRSEKRLHLLANAYKDYKERGETLLYL